MIKFLYCFVLTLISTTNVKSQYIVHESHDVATFMDKGQVYTWNNESNSISDSIPLFFSDRFDDNQAFINFSGVIWYTAWGVDGGSPGDISVNAYILRMTYESYRKWKSKGRFLASKVYNLGTIHTEDEFNPKFGLGQDSLFNVVSFAIYDSSLYIYNVTNDLGKQVNTSYNSSPSYFTISNFDDYSSLFEGEKSTSGYIFQDKSGYAILFGDSVILRVDGPKMARFETLTEPTSIVKRRSTFFKVQHELVPTSSILFLSNLINKE